MRATGLIPDTIRSPLRCHRRFRSDAKPRTRRSKAPETAVAIDDAEIAMTEACDVAVLMLGETYELAGERLADEYFITAPLDCAIPAYASDLVIGVVPGVLQAARQSARRRSPMCRWRRLLERFMRTLLIVMPTEAIEATLLLSQRRRGRFGCLCLQ
jgi:hypothetical protein